MYYGPTSLFGRARHFAPDIGGMDEPSRSLRLAAHFNGSIAPAMNALPAGNISAGTIARRVEPR